MTGFQRTFAAALFCFVATRGAAFSSDQDPLPAPEQAADDPVTLDAGARRSTPTLSPIESEQAGALLSKIDGLLARIDRSQFELDVLLDHLDYDADRIIEFVTGEIDFEQYPGLLRGARGTLLSRSGNSIDQAVLLATLLKDAGVEARIAVGSLPEAVMLQSLIKPRRKPPQIFGQSGQAVQAASTTEKREARVAVPPPSLPAAVLRVASTVQQALRAAGVTPGRASARGDELIPYYWVEYREAAPQAWRTVHPAVDIPSEVAASLTAKAYLTDRVAEDLQQRVRVQAYVERVRGGSVERLAVTDPIELPAANLSGQTFSYSVIPSQFVAVGENTVEDTEPLLRASRLFFPVFNFGRAQPGQAFDMMGNVLPPEDAMSAMTQLFESVGDRFRSAMDLMRDPTRPSLDESSASIGLRRHWVEITITRPGHEPKVIIRDLARWGGDPTEFRRSLARTVFFRVETGALSPAETLDRVLRTQRRIVESLASAQPLSVGTATLAQFSFDSAVFLLTSDLFAVQDGGVHAYRAEPTIVARYHPYGRVDLSREGFDIVSAPRHVVSQADGRPHPAGVFHLGVADTWLEHALFANQGWQRSAYGRLEQGGALAVLRKGDATLLEKMPEPTRGLIGKEIENGNVVVVTGDPADGDAWWRVSPASGEVLGMLANGWGGVIPEYLRDLAVLHTKWKIGSLAVSCGSAVAFLQASAALSALEVLNVNEALGFQGHDICSQLPSPTHQALCTLVAAAASAAAASGAASSGLSTAMLVRICVMSAL